MKIIDLVNQTILDAEQYQAVLDFLRKQGFHGEESIDLLVDAWRSYSPETLERAAAQVHVTILRKTSVLMLRQLGKD